jgi:hypothetical protein
MKVDAGNYEQMRAWFARLVPATFPADLLTAENDPVDCLDKIADRTPAKARSGLSVAINDVIEATDGWPYEKVESLDRLLEQERLPTLSEMRLRFSKVVRRVVARGSIKDEVEYHAVRNAAELQHDDAEALWKLLAAYEVQAST